MVELPQPSWQLNFKIVKEPELFYQYEGDQICSYGCSSSHVSIDETSYVSSSFPSSTAMPINFPALGDNLPVTSPAEQVSLNFQSGSTLEEDLMVDDWLVDESSVLSQQHSLEDDGGSLHMSSDSSKNVQPNQASLFSPASREMEADENLSILHLLKAYGEAIEMDALELAEEISKKLREKSCPTGSTLQRLAYYLIRTPDKQLDFLMEEAGLNYESAFKAFYQIFPFGRFAHFCANSVILAAVPDDAEVVRIVDFDIGVGVQWPPVIEALARKGKKEVKLIAIRWEEEDFSPLSGTQKFEGTKLKLLEYARTLGLRLMVEEMEMEALMSELKKVNVGGGAEWVAFNCMVGLPHMSRGRAISSVINFLKIAEGSTSGSCRGTITFGDGIGWGRGMTGQNVYGSIFEGPLVLFQAMLESIDCHVFRHLREARIAMECLFLMPYFASVTDQQMWEDIAIESRELAEVGLEACKMQKVNLMEAKELAREGESSYWASIEGAMENQMVLGYKGTPLVKLSSWR